jgi:hypothetical protein
MKAFTESQLIPDNKKMPGTVVCHTTAGLLFDKERTHAILNFGLVRSQAHRVLLLLFFWPSNS